MPIAASSDLGVAIAPGHVAAVAQVDWTYTVQVTNAGPSPATGVVATIPVPAGAQLVSASPSQGLAPLGQNGVLIADLGTIASGRIGHRHGRHRSVARRSRAARSRSPRRSPASQYDPDLANNQASLNLAVAPSVNIALALASTPQVVPSGQVVTFTASVSNLGTTPATGVIVAFPQVSGLAFVGSSPSQGTPALVSGQFFARLGGARPRRLGDGRGRRSWRRPPAPIR